MKKNYLAFALLFSIASTLPVFVYAQEDNKAAQAEDKIEEPAQPEQKTTGQEEVAQEKVETGAAEKKEEKRPPSVLEVNYENIESAGLFASARDGGLGKDIWDNAHRSYLIGLIERLPDSISSRTLRRLIKRALLTQTSADLIQNDIEIQPGRDLLTVRMEKLIDMGLYAQAFDLYSLLNKEPYHERLARAGILAMLYNGEKSLACLEANILGTRFSEIEFWQEFKAYCALTVSDNATEDDKRILQASGKRVFQSIAAGGHPAFSYNPQAFSGLSYIEQAVLVAEKGIGTGGLGNYRDIPARHLGVLLKNESLSDEQRFRLTVEAVGKNILEPEDLKKLYLLSDAGEKPIDTLAQWQLPAYFLYKVKNEKDPEKRWNILSQHVFGLLDNYGVIALSPYAEYMQNLKPANPTLSEIGATIRILHGAGQSISPYWSEVLGAMYNGNIAASDEYKRLYFIAFLSKTDYRKSAEEKERVDAFLSKSKAAHSLFLKNIIENLDRSYENDHNASKVYEKDFDLTSVEDYVMPSVDVWDRLVLVSQNRNIGETILLSTFALQGAPIDRFYPGVLRNVLMSFNTVGLTNVSRELIVEALLEI